MIQIPNSYCFAPQMLRIAKSVVVSAISIYDHGYESVTFWIPPYSHSLIGGRHHLIHMILYRTYFVKKNILSIQIRKMKGD